MFMQFLGIGIGHCNQNSAEAELGAGNDRPDGDDPQTCMENNKLERDDDAESADCDTEDDEDDTWDDEDEGG